MEEQDSRIIPLPDDVALQLSSSTTIPSLDAVILGLVENALDARAGSIDISIDAKRGACTVEDDGDGIPVREFDAEGGLGKRFYTSKFNSKREQYGQNGTFLSSVAALSTLSVTSRQRGHVPQSTLVLHHSRPAARFSKAPAHYSLPENTHGTRVVVQNLFGNMPVRVKQRAMSPSRSVRIENRTFETLKHRLVALLLSSCRPATILIHAAMEREKKVRIGPVWDSRSQNRPRTVDGEHVRDINKDTVLRIDLSLICRILTNAEYIEPHDWNSWIKTSARTLDVNISGAISLRPAPSKDVQFMSLGHKPLYQDNGNHILFEEVNKLFAASTFGHREEYSELAEIRRSKDRRFKQDGFTHRQLKGGGKGVDRWPMFYIRVDLPGQSDMKRLEREATINSILEVLTAMIHGFLKANRFQPRDLPKKTHQHRVVQEELQSSTMKRQKIDSFALWSRIKSSSRSTTSSMPSTDLGDKEMFPQEALTETTETTEFLGAPKFPTTNTAGDEVIEWINPRTKKSTYINSRTGLVVFEAARSGSPSASSISTTERASSVRISLRGPTSKGPVTPQHGTWAGELLSEWKNPVFSLPTEDAVPRVSSDSPLALPTRVRLPDATEIRKHFVQYSTASSARLSKQDLETARIVAQVDQKFVLISIRSPSSLLVLIDQHAADERIRFEDLLTALTSQPPESLAKPLAFELQSRERNLLTEYKSYFDGWGIQYAVSPSQSDICRLTVKSLPKPIAERCRAEPKILIELLRSQAWKMAEDPPPYDVAREPPTSQSAKQTRNPPRGIVDMLSSRACRSAIMFNDRLSVPEAESLVRRLAKCDLPFQCAHGRPSMVPIVDVGPCVEGEVGEGVAFQLGSEGYGMKAKETEPCFAEAWKAWVKGSADGDE